MKGGCPSGYSEELPMSSANDDDDDELGSSLVCALTIYSRKLVRPNTQFTSQC